jgi:hypothetical protein
MNIAGPLTSESHSGTQKEKATLISERAFMYASNDLLPHTCVARAPSPANPVDGPGNPVLEADLSHLFIRH